jgi:cation transport ATPase
MVDQSTLTGESIPVDADPGIEVYAGSIVRRGMALAEVTSTGAKPRFGRTAELVRIGHAASTEQRAIFGATRNLALMNGSLAVGIVAYAHSIAEPANDLVRLIGLALFWLPARALFRFGPLHLDDLTVCLGAGLATIIGLDLLKPLWRRHLAT